VKKLRSYPLAQAANPLKQIYIDMSGKLLDGVVAFDETFFDRLAKMVNEEPVMNRDLVAMGQLRSLGIEKGKDFKPDDAAKSILKQAAQEAHEGFMIAARGGEPWWPDSQWKLPDGGIGPRTGFTYQTDSALDVDSRGMLFFLAFAAPKKLGAASFYLTASNDPDGHRLEGQNSYRLHVPPNVPAKQYWAVTAYDLDTACLIRDMPSPGLDSYNRKMRRNADGSVDIYFGPAPPADRENNWVPTASGKPWLTIFRLYGPEKPLFEKTWKLPDIEKTN
jgi:hypothetical protein